MALNIIGGKMSRPQKIVFYGAEGLGKTTLAAQTPEPLIFDLENGSSHIAVRRVNGIADWQTLLSGVEEISVTPNICKTLIIDTADKAEEMCNDYVCAKFHKGGIEEFGYGKGYAYLSEEFCRLLKACDSVIAAGINVIFIAHAKMRKMELPDEQGAFDRWELKLSKQVAPLLKEWPDALLFLNYKTMVVKTDDTHAKAQGGQRVIYTSHHPCWDAKNRHGLAEELPLEYASVRTLFENEPAAPKAVDLLRQRMNDSQITEAELRKVIGAKGHFPESMPVDSYPDEFITGWVLRYWNKIVETVENDPDKMPF